MKGLEELLVMAFELMATDDDLMPCCNKPKHMAKFLRIAMTAAARTCHEQEHGLTAGAYVIGALPPFEKCWGFPCRIVREEFSR